LSTTGRRRSQPRKTRELKITVATPQSFTVASRPELVKPSVEFPAMAWRARAAIQPESTGLELAEIQEA